MISKIFLKFFLSFFFYWKITTGSYINDNCQINGEHGKCQLLKNCPRAIDDLNFRNIQITLCPEPNYVRLNPIVCCLSDSNLPNDNNIPPEWLNLPISERKCREYNRDAVKNYITILLPNSTSQRKENCVSGFAVIAGGIEAVEKEFPHMVVIGYTKEDSRDSDAYDFRCTGSLLSELFVLSAAHCSSDEIPKIAMFGVLKMSDTNHREIRGISKIILNEENDYDVNNRLHDIILFKLNASLIFNEYIMPVCLPLVNHDIGTQFLASGWGQRNLTVFKNDHLLKVVLTSSDENKCKTRIPYFNKSVQLCAGSVNEFKDTCNGDSGGGLTIKNPDITNCMLTIVGIVSYGEACMERNTTQSVYTRVTAYVKWIECKIWNSC